MKATPTIVLSAFAANPNMSSETGIGWSFIRATALNAQIHGAEVIAVMNSRSVQPVKDQLLLEGLGDLVQTIGLDVPRVLSILKRPQLTRLEYLVWWVLAKRLMRSLERERNVVLAHHVTFATEIFPTPITAFSKKVFRVWGPVGSAGDKNVYRLHPRGPGIAREARLQAIRDMVAAVPAKHVGRGVDLVLAQNQSVADLFSENGIANRVFPNVVLKAELQSAIRQARDTSDAGAGPRGRGIRILSIGHLVPRKRFDLGLAVLLEPALAQATYQILGRPLEGVKDDLPALAAKLGVADRVIFSGKLPRTEVLAAMAGADVLFHPSGREGASGVVGEATAVGIPVVCFAGTGASSVLDASGSSGIALDASPLLSTGDIAAALGEAALLERTPSDIWTESRFQRLCEGLLSEGFARASERARILSEQPIQGGQA
jgi:glycosyltransferase involved in cell wall biosynthesis